MWRVELGPALMSARSCPTTCCKWDAAARKKAPGPGAWSGSAYARLCGCTRAAAARHAFRADQAALDVFPTTLWAQVVARRLRRASAQLLSGGEALGYRPLRQAVAAYLNASRGVKCTADQVLIISGVQEALERAAHLLLDPGEPVWWRIRAIPERPLFSGRSAPKSSRFWWMLKALIWNGAGDDGPGPT